MPARQLADDRRQPEALGQLGAHARHRDQQRQLHQQQEDGVSVERAQRRELLHVSRADKLARGLALADRAIRAPKLYLPASD